MLSRTADNLFWASRYLERAEGAARLIEMGLRMTLIPGQGREEWRSVAAAIGASDAFGEEERISERRIVEKLVLCPDTPSSLRSCLARARANGKSVRTKLTQEMWEALNDGWRRLELMGTSEAARDLPGLVDWVKRRSAAFRGAVETSMLRSDAYYFLRIGGNLERSDLTLRLLDVKYFVLLPETDVVGGGRDHHQWTTVLHATSALRSYHHLYRGDFGPWNIADFLILNRQFPRSVAYCWSEMLRYLDHLAAAYDKRGEAHQQIDRMTNRLNATGMGEIFQTGLHDFAAMATADNARLSSAIARDYYF